MGGYGNDGKYYGSDSLGPGEMEWLPPATDDAVPLEDETYPIDLDDNDSQPSYREERYTGRVGGVDYGSSKRPGSDPYSQTHGRLTPLQIPCLPPPDGCGAKVGDRCTFELSRTVNKHRTDVTGERHMACRTRQKRADAS